MNDASLRTRRLFLVIDGGRVLFRSADRARAWAYQQGWNSPTATVVKVLDIGPQGRGRRLTLHRARGRGRRQRLFRPGR